MVHDQPPTSLSVADRQARGEEARTNVPPDAHTGWRPSTDRGDPIALLESQNATREPDLIPVRHGRMMASAFTFYRGSAAIMAADLAGTPTAGLDVQLCGDAHLSNFGVFASPERELLFDLNDFDETLPGPFEYDLLRLAASFAIAARHNKFDPDHVRKACETVGRAYRTAMAGFASLGTLDIWYAKMSEDDVRTGIEHIRRSLAAKEAKEAKRGRPAKTGKPAVLKKEAVALQRSEEALRKAHNRTNLQALSKLTEVVDGKQRIISQPPVLIPLRELALSAEFDALDLQDVVRQIYGRYRDTLSDTRRRLLDEHTIVDVARKVVGVGSVGTRAFVVLLQGRDERDPLFLQVKEATRSCSRRTCRRAGTTTAVSGSCRDSS